MNTMYQSTAVSFDKLSPQLLYDILALRNEVFIVGQQSVYQDIDYQDQKALHFLMHDSHCLAAYARILVDNQAETVSFGRVLTAAAYRGKGLGKQLITQLLQLIHEQHPDYQVKISAQFYLIDFYRNYGFREQGEAYILENIKHITMVKAHEK